MNTKKIAMVALMVLGTAGVAGAADPAAGYGPNRHPAAPDVVLQENAARLRVDPWTVHAAIAIAAAASPDIERLRGAAQVARDAWEKGKGSEEAVRAARTAVRNRVGAVLAEIEGLLTPDQARALRGLVREERRS